MSFDIACRSAIVMPCSEFVQVTVNDPDVETLIHEVIKIVDDSAVELAPAQMKLLERAVIGRNTMSFIDKEIEDLKFD